MKTGIHIPYMETTTAFETKLQEHLNEAITVGASFRIIKEVIKPFNVCCQSNRVI